MKFAMTKEGQMKLETELKDLKHNQRPEVIEAIAAAREHGDLKENAEYHAARERQSWIEGRIMEIEHVLANANVVDVSKIKSRNIMFGAKVTLVNEDTDVESTYRIVGEFESDLNKGLISNTSPLGKALLGKKKGDSVEVAAPGGSRYYEVLKVSYRK